MACLVGVALSPEPDMGVVSLMGVACFMARRLGGQAALPWAGLIATWAGLIAMWAGLIATWAGFPMGAGRGGGCGQPAAARGLGVVAGHERLGAGAHGHHAAGRAGGRRVPIGRQRQRARPLPRRPPEPG